MSEETRRPEEWILDELSEQFQRTRSLLQSTPDAAANRALERLGGQAEVEARIAVQLSRADALVSPGRFADAHRQAVRALEVLDREGFASPVVRGFGPLDGLLAPLVEFVAEYIVKSFAETVAGRMRSLYARREAQALPRTESRMLLARARVEMDRLSPGFSGGGVLAPLLLAASIALPAFAGLGNLLGAVPLGSRAVLLPLMAVLAVVSYTLAAILLQGAAIARRRSRLIMRLPLAALWETIGAAGDPPEDEATLFGAVALILTGLAWIIVPIIGIIVFVGL